MALFKTFGSNPSGKDISRINESLNFRNGSFQNLSATRALIEGASYLKMTWKFLNKPSFTAPPVPLPSIKTELKSVAIKEPTIVWFGHSSYFIRLGGKNVLVDPVFSGYASPFSFTGRSFHGSDAYTVSDLPDIDLLIITHDHYDHLDFQTIMKLKPVIGAICTSLGVGSHLRYWGIDPGIITEFDWWESETIAGTLRITAAPARHFSGRSFTRNKTLWSSFILEGEGYKFYLGGDSGYDVHFKEIGERFGSFDIAMLETGQYGTNWPFIHMMPEETAQAAVDLHAKVLMPVHWGKFALAMHPWNEPIQRVVTKARELNLTLTTPMIGEPVIVGKTYPASSWWEAVK